jgi:hypothetical protein
MQQYNIILLIAFHVGSSWLTAARKISSVPLANFEVFHPMSHSAGTHKGISIDMMKLIRDVCSRTVLLYEEFNYSTHTKQYITYSSGPRISTGA